MPPKSLEWKRILTANARPHETRQTEPVAEILTPSSATDIGVVLQSYEQLFLEKEQLRNECIELRREINRLTKRPERMVQREPIAPRASDAFEVLNRLNACIETLQRSIRSLEKQVEELHQQRNADVETDRDPPLSEGNNGNDSGSTFAAEPTNGSERNSVAEMVAEWMFARPNAAQVRLVEDALRGQGVRVP